MKQSEETRSKLGWLIVGLIAIGLMVYMFYPFLDVLIYGIFVYYVARPVYRAFTRRFKYPRVGAFISLVFLVLPLVLIAFYTLSIAYIELSKFFIYAKFEYIELYIKELVSYFDGIAKGVNQTDISDLISQGDIVGFINTLTTTFSDAIFTVFDIFFRLFLTFAIAYYLLKDGTKLREWITDAILGGKSALTKQFFEKVDSDLHEIYYGNVLTAVLTALIAAVTFLILNLVAPPLLVTPYPFLLAVLCGIGIFIPLVGMKLIWIPLWIYLVIQAYLNGILFTDGWYLLLFLIVVGVAADFTPDTILRPYISGKHIHVGALLFVYIFGIAVFGFVGLFLGPIILVVATRFVEIVLPELNGRSRLQKRHL
ncbi:MAG: hypothetical protein C5S38_08630 [Candidatus Methanophagaceae archaeon]|nr:MAG: hypothetical protein C5S38_08630 [Methanophagales archaeon]KAF5436441.1 putative PurR-regulated permease PerM [Methanophagales archaeon]